MKSSITPHQREAVIEAMDTNPKLAKAFVALVEATRSGELAARSNHALQKAAATLPKPKAPPTEGGGRIETVDVHQAVVGQISVHGEHVDTLLSQGSFNKTRVSQIAYAETLGYRLATREEHLAYVNSLLSKERAGSINNAESNALGTYRERFVRDTEGGLVVNARRISANVSDFDDYAGPGSGALFVRASASSQL
jgi:hypothetical protein